MKADCKHKWKLMSRMHGISEYERVVAVHSPPKCEYAPFYKSKLEIPNNLSKVRTLIHIFQCKRCGELKKFVDKY